MLSEVIVALSNWLLNTSHRWFAPHSTHLCMHDWCLLFDFLSVQHNTDNNTDILDLLPKRILNFTQVCVLIFLPLSWILVLWYEMKSSRTFCCAFQYKTVEKGNQHGGREYDDLQNQPANQPYPFTDVWQSPIGRCLKRSNIHYGILLWISK